MLDPSTGICALWFMNGYQTNRKRPAFRPARRRPWGPSRLHETQAQSSLPADDSLRGEVQSLLAQQADSFLASGPVSVIKRLSPGAKLGNFEIVELIGRGGYRNQEEPPTAIVAPALAKTSASSARMRSAVSESGDNTSLAGESGRYDDV
jgi:hypothetical protein